jgi:hypothetical protein
MQLRGLLLVLCTVCWAPADASADLQGGKGQKMNLAFVLLGGPQFPKGEDVVRAFPAFAGKDLRLRLRPNKEKPPSAAVLEFELGSGGKAFVASIPAAVPKGEADSGVRFSISALGTGWKLPAHKAHLVVTLQESESTSSVEALSRFTSLLAAVAKASRAVGIYWGGAGATHDANFFISTAESQGIVPRIMLWTGVSVAGEADGRLSLLSLGMNQLNLPDLLLVAPKSASDAALETFVDLLGYLAQVGKPLPEGDTVGRSADERLPVRYVPSPIDGTTKVWRVELK